MDFDGRMKEYVDQINAELIRAIPEGVVDPLKLSMRYSLLAGGKRLRPVLCLAANALRDGDIKEAMPLAVAVEMIHTYSLIHDDLPAMDNDQLRRGKPTNHVIFGEAMAILAGDGLLSYAMEKMMDNIGLYPTKVVEHLKAINSIVHAAGIFGMVAGQCLDLEAEGRSIKKEELYAIHSRKTGALIKAPLLAGLYLCRPSGEEVKAIEAYGEELGLCFQIVDDILDVMGDQEKLGKSIGKDEKEDKLTYPKLYGVDKSKELAKEHGNKAVAILEDAFGERAEFLCELARRQINREM